MEKISLDFDKKLQEVDRAICHRFSHFLTPNQISIMINKKQDLCGLQMKFLELLPSDILVNELIFILETN